MSTVQLLQLGLALHLTGITMMVGIFLAGFLNYQQILKFLPDQREKALVVAGAAARFPLFQWIGGILIVLGGMGMMVAADGAFVHQTWFNIKMGLLIVLVANALVMARPARKKMRKILGGDFQDDATISTTKRRLMVFYLSQLGIFLAIFVLAAFKFN